MFLASPWLDDFADFEQFKIHSYFTDFGQITVILPSLGKILGHWKQFKPSPFDKKFKNHAKDQAQVDSISTNQEMGSPVNKWPCKFFWIVGKWLFIFIFYLFIYFLTVLPRSMFRTQPKVYGETFSAKIINNLQLLTFFAKRSHYKCLTLFQKYFCCL